MPNIFMISLTCQKFHSNGSHGIVGRTTGFEAVGTGSSLCRAKYFYDFTDICQKFHSNGSHGIVGRTTGF